MSDFAFRVDLVGLEDLIARLAEFERRAETLAEDVELQVRRLHGEWTGRAADEHLDAHRQWRHGDTTMHEAAAALRQVAATAHGNYSSAVAANARMWG